MSPRAASARRVTLRRRFNNAARRVILLIYFSLRVLFREREDRVGFSFLNRNGYLFFFCFAFHNVLSRDMRAMRALAQERPARVYAIFAAVFFLNACAAICHRKRSPDALPPFQNMRDRLTKRPLVAKKMVFRDISLQEFVIKNSLRACW